MPPAATLDIAAENNVILIGLPPHSTHVTQPLDVGIMRILKTYWTQVLDIEKAKDPFHVLDEQAVIELLCKPVRELGYTTFGAPHSVWTATFTKSNVISAFCKTGIWPVNFNAVEDGVYGLIKIDELTPSADSPSGASEPSSTGSARPAYDDATPEELEWERQILDLKRQIDNLQDRIDNSRLNRHAALRQGVTLSAILALPTPPSASTQQGSNLERAHTGALVLTSHEERALRRAKQVLRDSKKSIEQGISEAKAAWKVSKSAAKKHNESARAAVAQADKRALAAEKHLAKAQEAFANKKSTNADIKAIDKAVASVGTYLAKVAEQARLAEHFLAQANFAEATMVDHEEELKILREEARRDGFADDGDAEEEEEDEEDQQEEEEEEDEEEDQQAGGQETEVMTSIYCDRAAASMARASAAKATALAMIQGASMAPASASTNFAQEAVGLTGSVAWPRLPETTNLVPSSGQIPASNGATNPEHGSEPPLWV